MKKSQAKIISLLSLFLILFSLVAYGIASTLITPTEGAIDDDGYLDLRGKCESKSQNEYDGTTSWNVTNATLWSNVDGTWKPNATLQVSGDKIANTTYFFNFTNHINQTAIFFSTST